MFNKRYILMMCIVLLLCSFISSAQLQTLDTGYVIETTPQNYLEQNQNYTVIFFVRNITNGVLIDNSSTNCTFYLSNSLGNILIANEDVTYSNGYWHYLILSGNFSDVGTYSYGIGCEGIGLAGAYAETWDVTPNGIELTIGRAVIDIGLLLIFVIFLIGTVVLFMESENLLARVGMFGLGYLLLIAITFVSWNMANDFLLSAPFIASMFRILFFVLVIGLFPLVIGAFAYYFIMLFKIKEIENLMKKGVPYSEANEIVKRRRR